MLRTNSAPVTVGLMLALGFVSEGHGCGDTRNMVNGALREPSSTTQPANTSPTPPTAKKRSRMWWRSDDARTELGITAQQSRDLEAIFQQTLPMLRVKKAEVDREEEVLSTLLAEANTSRESAVIQAIERVEARRRSLSRTFTMMRYRMYRLLTPEQRAKVLAYRDQHAKSQGIS
jgi:Spy/CpxP family protein refolding chaperone